MDIYFIIIATISCYMIIHNITIIYYCRIIKYFQNNEEQNITSNVIKMISIIIPQYNEERFIYEKMTNIAESVKKIDKPYEVIIGSDGSDDSSCQIIEDFIKQNQLSNWKLFEYQNEGKCQTINKLIKESCGDLIISTDADVTMEKNAIQIILQSFEEDYNIGCLSSTPILRAGDVKFQSIYWNYEIKLRDMESQMGKLVVSTGGLYAYRKELFSDIPKGIMADDMWIPLNILLKNFKSIHRIDLKLILEETDEKTEAKRRKRVVAGGIDVAKRLFLNLIKEPTLFFIFFSHKINRWLSPLWGILLIISTILFSYYFLIGYAFILLILIIYITPKKFYYIVYTLTSPLFSIVKFFKTKDISKWGHTRK